MKAEQKRRAAEPWKMSALAQGGMSYLIRLMLEYVEETQKQLDIGNEGVATQKSLKDLRRAIWRLASETRLAGFVDHFDGHIEERKVAEEIVDIMDWPLEDDLRGAMLLSLGDAARRA